MQAASGRRNHIKIFGDNYYTPDGTCVRDYLHINDLCEAHLLAIKFLRKNNKSNSFNLGNEEGFSVQEVISSAKQVAGVDFSMIKVQRRDGDPAQLVADSDLAQNVLEWQP